MEFSVSAEYWPSPHEQFQNESTHFLEQISNVLIFFPCSFKFIVLNYPIISVKKETKILWTTKEPISWRSQRPHFPSSAWFEEAVLVNLYQISETVSVIKLLSCSITPIRPSNTSGCWGWDSVNGISVWSVVALDLQEALETKDWD